MIRWFVPGRLEVFGKHTDYAGGRSILAAVDRGITVELTEYDGVGIVATSTSVPGEVNPGGDLVLPTGHWGRYVTTVVERLTLNFGDLTPARISVDSTLPLASGMSSSSALVVALALALIDHNGIRKTTHWRANVTSLADEAAYLACIENGMPFKDLAGFRGVGTFGGSEDHTAMLCCREGMLAEFSFCPVEERSSIEFPDEWSFVIAVSGVLAEKTGTAQASYNRAALGARSLVDAWNDATGRGEEVLADAVAIDLEMLRELVSASPDLSDRLRAFVTESEVAVPAALAAIKERDIDAFGRAADLSHRNADEALGNQTPETNRLQGLARALGAHGSASFGAGFGGSVWALVDVRQAEDFAERWLAAYLAEFPEFAGRASTLVTRPGPPAHRI